MTEKLLVPDIGEFENVEVIELLVREGQEIKKKWSCGYNWKWQI